MVERLVAIFRERAQRTADIVAVGAEIHLDGFALEPVLERPGIEIAGAVIEQRRDEIGGAGFARRVLDRAADESEVDGDQRHGRLVHQPGLDAAWAHHAFDRRRISRQRPPRSAAHGNDDRCRGAADGRTETSICKTVHEWLLLGL